MLLSNGVIESRLIKEVLQLQVEEEEVAGMVLVGVVVELV